ncbi:hypothetical protein FQN54_003758 [Arachnomyces sp. PD_36]|nr:hypothetical protein FQN54_003758 [Arachnomyces sp. PD_36]
MDNLKASEYLKSLLGRTLRIHTTDTRLFVGAFKCSDNDRNIILGGTYEYRYPDPSTDADITSRFIGLVVVPGQHITKIELDAYPNEVRGQASG